MKTEKLRTAGIAALATLGGVVAGGTLFRAPPAVAAGVVAAEPPPAPVMGAAQSGTPAMTAATVVRPAGPVAPGSLQVTRLSDTTFVVVKDQGDAEVVTLFSTAGDIVTKKHSGRFFY